MNTPPAPREQFGPYRIIARVGAGGMGEVFKAWDPRLERDVAIKLLHPEMAGDPDRQRRLVAEGRAASALNHPNIVRVYDADVDGDSYYLVSEWLEGKSLRDELSRGPLPLKRLLDLAVQIADGLAAAHAIGIVHRDIKPENIMLARDGTARIVDFGLARSDPHAPAMAAAIGGASTMTASLEGGLSGTPAYMSPEQARGTTGDFRTDQFSFGALLYEMATGKYAFRRDTLADTLSAVLHDEPMAISELNPRIPVPCRWIIEQCLAKDAAERYAATEDLARELRRVRDRLLEVMADPIPLDVTPAGPRLWPRLLAGTAAVAAGMLIGWPLGTVPAPQLRFMPLASASAYEGEPAWSADGQSLAYVADVDGVLQVFVRRIGDALSHQATRGRFDAQRPFWAPSGQLLYFISLAGESEALWAVSVAGGAPELVYERVVAAAIDSSGRQMALIRTVPGTTGKSLWWSAQPGAEPVKEIQSPFDRLEAVAAQLAFNRNGQLLVWTNRVAGPNVNGLDANSFHLFDAPGTAPRRVLSHLARYSNLPAFSWRPDGRHIVLALADEGLANRHLWAADVKSDTVERITATHTNETDPAAAPVGDRVAYATDEVDFDLVLVSPDGRSRQSLLSTARNEFAPTWSPVGDQFAFLTDRAGSIEIWSRSRDGQWERPVVTPADFGNSLTESMGSLAFSPDARTLAYQRSSGGAFEVWLSPVAGGKPIRLLDAPASNILPYQDSPSWSPDGQWIAFTEDGVLKKFRVGSKEAVLLAERTAPYAQTRWSPDGRTIACQLQEGLTLVPADGGPATLLTGEAVVDFAWAPDSRRVFALAESEVVGHFALVEIDSITKQTRVLNPDLGSIPVANQPIRGFSYLPSQGFLTSLASARSDIWLLEGLQAPPSWIVRILGRFR